MCDDYYCFPCFCSYSLDAVNAVVLSIDDAADRHDDHDNDNGSNADSRSSGDDWRKKYNIATAAIIINVLSFGTLIIILTCD